MDIAPSRKKTASARFSFSTLFGTSSSSTLYVADLKPPQPPPVWTHTPEDILSLTKEAIERDREVLNQVARLPDSKCSFNTVFSLLARSRAVFETITGPLAFYQHVSPYKELHDASIEATNLIRDYDLEVSGRNDVYNAKVMARKNIKFPRIKHNLEERGLMILNAYDCPGKRAKRSELRKVNVSEEQHKQWRGKWEELSHLRVEFMKNFDNENDFVSFTLKELEGVPQDVISNYTKHTEDGKELYDVTHKSQDILPLFKYAQNAETRQQAYESYEACLELNAPLLDHILELRHTLATGMGYKSWADYRTKWRRVGSGDKVEKFLTNLKQILHPLGVQEHESLLQLKADELKAKGEPFDGELYVWDYQYYKHLYLKKSPHLRLDHDHIKEYFPASAVIPETLEIFQNFFGVSFHEVKGLQTWHPDVQLFAVWNADAKDEMDFLGYCYLDLFQRASKCVHGSNSAVQLLCPGYLLSDGKHHAYPVVAMTANLAKPTLDCPALMLHSDVIWFFHEMGHLFHNLLSCTQLSNNHGTRTVLDFKEAPSQLVENWCWEPKVLTKISRHYKTNEALSAELIERIVKSRDANIGLDYLHQIFLASFDLQVHTHQARTDEQDTMALWNDLREQITLLKGGKGIAGQGSFKDLILGFDVGCYASIYSEAFADDMYLTIFKDDSLDPERGSRFRKIVLQPGGSRGSYPLTEFLGRPPKQPGVAFKEKINKIIEDRN